MNRRRFLHGTGAAAMAAAFFSKGGLQLFADDPHDSNSIQPITNKMLYRTLGKTGIKVSAIALGIEGIQHLEPDKIKKLIDYAYSRGINFMDICLADPNMLSGYRAAIAGKRSNFIIQAHFCTEWKNGQYRRTRHFPDVKNAFEGLMRDLDTDYIDVGMIHYCDDEKDFNQIFNGPIIEYVKELKKAGKIRAIGISTHTPEIVRMAVESKVIDVVMFSLNLSYDVQSSADNKLEFNANRTSLYDLCEREGVAIDVMKAFAGGNLLDAKQSPFGIALTPVQCLHYALTRPAAASVMAGCGNEQEIDAAAAWCTASADERDYSRILAAKSNLNTGKCLYCGHCAPCPQGIDIASVNKYLNLAKAQSEIPATVRSHYDLLSKHASDCIQCGSCEKRCPFGVRVREKMKEAVQLFGN